jgi:hypothetical protein
MEAKCSSETSVGFQRATRHYITEDRTLHNHRCDYTILQYLDNFTLHRFKLVSKLMTPSVNDMRK